jgi:3-deoxy-D-manno-octulosonic-acid transferase
MKFREARELIAIGGACSINQYETLEAQFTELFKNKEAGRKAGEYVKLNTGATALILDSIR